MLKRPEIRKEIGLTIAEIDTVLDVLAAMSRHTSLHFLWRPQLRDANDEMVLETAANAGADAIVTFNQRDFFPAASNFHINIMPPRDFLRHLPQRSKS